MLNMRKNILFLSLLLLLSLTSGSCKKISNNNETKEVILASFTVLADIISNVAKDDFIIRSITKPGVEVHGYQPTPSDLVMPQALLFLLIMDLDLNYGLKNLFLT